MIVHSKGYKNLQKRAQGSKAEVYLGRQIDLDSSNGSKGQIVAIKRIQLSRYPADASIVNEIISLRNCSHPNIVQHYDTVWADDGQFVWIVLEYMDFGSLSYLIRGVYIFPERSIAAVLSEITQGLVHLHSKNIIHRNIKSSNILLDNSGHVKIADFSFCSLGGPISQSNTPIGSAHWMAPEVIKNEQHGTKVDAWSLGITAIEMMERLPPYSDQSPQDAMATIVANGTPSLRDSNRWSNKLKGFLSMCLCSEVGLRASAEELLGHSFLRRGQKHCTPCTSGEIAVFLRQVTENYNY